MVKIDFRGSYLANLTELLLGSPELKEKIDIIVGLFRKNPKDTRLDSHELKRRMEGKWAFSITDDIRIIYRWVGKNTAEFLAIGGHKKVYGKNK